MLAHNKPQPIPQPQPNNQPKPQKHTKQQGKKQNKTPYKNQMRKRLSKDEYVAGVLEGSRMILSRAITLIESQLDTDKALAREVLETLLPHTGNSVRLGITGVPGVGKSTFIETFSIIHYRNTDIGIIFLSDEYLNSACFSMLDGII